MALTRRGVRPESNGCTVSGAPPVKVMKKAVGEDPANVTNETIDVAKKKQKTTMGTIDIEECWKRDLAEIAEMRKNEDAPVDSIGCHKLHDTSAEPKVQHFQILLALMLSSQTKDEVTSAAMQRLRVHGCTVDSMLSTQIAVLEKLLHPVGFYKRKALYIKEAATVLRDKYNDEVPSSLVELCALKGVGPKMAHLVMQTAFGRTEGIAVDTHVHRIVNRLGWTKTNNPEQTRTALQTLLPRSEWSRVNKLLVGFGQTICQPVRPRCEECALRRSCPSSSAKK